ncbi:hypothetical protein C8J31_10285 [Rhizobium sp. PP-CC-2G-626]|nr:hypothetical protein C8J31_10285 [Rhizobium sp. PP-CC-2G-626]
MKFKLVDKYRYWWPVIINVPDPENPGKVIKQQFKIEFEPEDIESEIARIEEIAKLPAKEQQQHEHDGMRKVIKNWDEVEDDAGSVIFTPEALEKALRWNWFRIGVHRAYAESLSGGAARLGN